MLLELNVKGGGYRNEPSLLEELLSILQNDSEIDKLIAAAQRSIKERDACDFCDTDPMRLKSKLNACALE